MTEILNNIYNFIITLINSSTIYGPLIASFLIFLESIIPILPLFVFITITFIAYGNVVGFLVSYILTCLGCFFAFFLCRKGLHNLFTKYVRKYNSFDNIMQKIDKISLPSLVILIAIPFTPAFLVNIASAISHMHFKKFAVAALIGKISLVFFWGFIGTSLVDSLKNPKILIIILFMLLVAYLISKYAVKKLDIE